MEPFDPDEELDATMPLTELVDDEGSVASCNGMFGAARYP